MRLLGEWWYAVKVCFKYKILWNPFRDLSNASFYCKYNNEGEVSHKIVNISPFYPNFIDTFMHEVGHLTLYKRGTAQKVHALARANMIYETETIWYNGKILLATLVEESLASRFARKALKSKADTKYLVRAFQTYSKWGYEEFLFTTPEDARTITKLTDFVERGIRRIEK